MNIKKLIEIEETLFVGWDLTKIDHPYDLSTVIESYPPNVAHCKEKLVPLGVTLHENSMDSSYS